jgi:hypothetical protein
MLALEARMSEQEATTAEQGELLKHLIAKDEVRGEAAIDDDAARAERPGYSVDALVASMGGALGRSGLYKEWREGRGPAFIRVRGRRFITPEQRAAWLRKMEAEQLATRMAEAKAAEGTDDSPQQPAHHHRSLE